MKVRYLDIFQDCRRGFVCKTLDITDAEMPRSAPSCGPLDDTCYFGVPGRLRNYLVGHIVKRYRELLDVSRDATEDLIDGRCGRIHLVTFPYEMARAFEVKSRLLERQDVLVIDFDASIQSSPKYDNLLVAKLKLVTESVIEIAGSYPDHFFDWRK